MYTAAITKYCVTIITNISISSTALKQNKQRRCRCRCRSLQTLKAKKLHHKGIIYHQTCAIGYKLVFFLRSTCRHEIRHNKNLSCETTKEKQENHKIRPFSTRKGMKFMRVHHKSATTLTTGMKES